MRMLRISADRRQLFLIAVLIAFAAGTAATQAGIFPRVDLGQAKFKQQCHAAGGTVRGVSNTLTCTYPNGSKQTCQFAKPYGWCTGAAAIN